MKKTALVLGLAVCAGILAAQNNMLVAQNNPLTAQNIRTYKVYGANIVASEYMSGIPDTTGTRAVYEIEPRAEVPYTQQCVNQKKASAKQGNGRPYYNVREALPIPSCYTPTEQGEKAGLDWGVYTHLHSAGMEVLPNGDILAVYFSTPAGKAEADTSTTFVQCRRRYGSDEWDMPELLFSTRGGNDQSALLFVDGNTVWLFAGGRDMTDAVPFRLLKSTDNGATWTFSVPQMDKPLTLYTAQPITSAFRNGKGEIFMAIDGKESQSFLLRSQDNGITWHDMGGRTSSRHSAIIMLDKKGTLLSAGGKNGMQDGWNPMNISTDWGASWSEAAASPFPPMGTAQRPCIIRLQSGALCLVGDSYMHKKKIAPPEGWAFGNECYVAISRDNGQTWKFKTLPVTLPQHHRTTYPSLGYVTLRQGRDGLIHVLTTTNYPGLEIEFNEAWIDADIVTAKGAEGTVFGKPEALTPLAESGYHVLNGTFTEKFPNGKLCHVVTYCNGRRTGVETLYREDGTKVWEWERNLSDNTASWAKFDMEGNLKLTSCWNILPQPRDLPGVWLLGAEAEGLTRVYDKSGAVTDSTRFHKGVMEGGFPVIPTEFIKNEGK